MGFKEDILATKSLQEAVSLLFGLDCEERYCILDEPVLGDVAKCYDDLGKIARCETYKNIVTDFKLSTGCYDVGLFIHKEVFNTGKIIDIGCGSGLLTIELFKQTGRNCVGIDISQDMLDLAKINSEFSGVNYIEVIHNSVYNLEAVNLQGVEYIVCRNVLHRLKHVEEAIKQMYSVLPDKGSIYIRDLKRDADWQIVLERIDDERWKRPELVRDYIGAMAGMLTINELDILLSGLGINNFEIRSGEYLVGGFLGYERDENTINEYECEVEYVCVIRKNKNI